MNNKSVEELVIEIEDVIRNQEDDTLFSALCTVLGVAGYTGGVEKKFFVSLVVDAISSVYELHAEENK